MRYWIWWNDLVQGPFELDELTSLKAFSGDLLVCMEDREDWIPASRVADLSGAVEQQSARGESPKLPPPAPPKRTNPVTPLQGEFFGEPPGQQSLIEPEGGTKGPFAYRPVAEGVESLAGTYLQGRATMPFHFLHQPESSNTAVLDLPRPSPERMRAIPPRVVRESPLPKIEEAPPIPLNVVEIASPEPESIPEEIPQPISEPVLARDRTPSRAPYFEELPAEDRKPQWLPWILGIALVLAALGSVSFWLIDRASTHSAIAEANRLTVSETGAAARRMIPTPVATHSTGVYPTTSGAQPTAVVTPVTPNVQKQNIVPSTKGVAVPRVVQTAVQKVKTVAGAIKDMVLSFFGLGKAAPAAAIAGTPAAGMTPGVPAGAPSARISRSPSVNTHKAAKAAPKRLAGPKRVPIKPAAAAPEPAPGEPAETVTSAATPTASKKPLPGIAIAPASPAEPAAQAAIPSAPMPTPAEVAAPEAYTKPASERAPNPWRGKENEAIGLVQNKHLPKSKTTVGEQARTMLQEMHEKELLHAADTGERLYLPDKITWAALEEEGSRYRVYLNFLAMQASGERVQTRSYQFVVDLKTKEVRADDPGAEQDLLTQPAALTFKHNPMATDIDSILGGVDAYNKHKMSLIIVKKNNRNREERKKIETAMAAAQAKVQRAVIYFRRTYTEKALQNIAKAYVFADLLKG